MNRFLNLLTVFAILVMCTTFAFAVDNKDGLNSKASQQLQREVIGDDLGTQHSSIPHSDNYVRPQSVSKVALAGTYTIGVGGNYEMLRNAVAALQAEGVSAPVTFLFTDVSYTDTGQTIGGYPGQGPANLVTFKPAPGVVVNLKFSGGVGTASYTGLSGGFNFRTASGILLDGSNSGGDDRSWTIESDTIAPNTQGRAPLGMYRGCNNITVKNMLIKGNRRSNSNAWGIISNDNLGMGAFGAQFNITYHNNHFKQGNAIAFVRGAGSGAIADRPADSNYTFTNNIFGGLNSTQVLDHMATGISLAENVNNVLIDNNDFYGIKIVGSPVIVAIRGGNRDVIVSNNKFHNIVTLSGANRPILILIGNITTAGNGIAPVTQAKFINNMFYDIHNYGVGSGSRTLSGILGNPTGLPNTPNGTGSYIEYYHNTFNFDLGLNEGGNPPFTAFFFDANWLGGSNTPDVTIFKNNIVSFKRENGFSRNYLIFTPVSEATLIIEADYNLYNQADGGAFGQYPVPWPMGASTVKALLSDWQEITGNDLNSKQGLPIFVSSTSAHIRNLQGDASAADMMGTNLTPAITHDIDGQLRADYTPVDVGADAFISYPWEYDALPLSILGPPLEGIKVGTDGFPKVKVRNNGSFELDIPITVNINSVPVYTSTQTAMAVPPFSEVEVTFTTAFNHSVAGEYTIEVTTEYVGDQNPGNDGPITRNLFVVPAVPVPTTGYFNNFDEVLKTTATGLVQGGWLSAATAPGPDDWLLGTPAKPTISSAYSHPNSFVTGPLDTNYALNWQAAVYSPFFILSELTNPIVRFALAFKTEPDYDAAIFEYTTDGVDWVLANRTNAINWYNREPDYPGLYFYPYPCWNGVYESGPIWRIATITLPDLAGAASVRFRLHFGSDPGAVDEGVAFDNFEILNGAKLAGMKFLDVNYDGVKDSGEPGVPKWTINLAPYHYTAVTDADGKYQFPDNIVPGPYTVYEEERAGWVQTYPTTIPPTYEFTVTPGGGLYDNLDFGNYKDVTYQDLSIKLGGTILVPPTWPPVRYKRYGIMYRNNGIASVPGTEVVLTLPSQVVYESSSGGVHTNGTVTFNTGNLHAEFVGWLWAKVIIPSTVPNGAVLLASATITPLAGDQKPADNFASSLQINRPPYDPNDKLVSPEGDILPEDILKYTVRFQNVGSGPATNVWIFDTLDAKLNWGTVVLGASSHLYEWEILDGNVLKMSFLGINLPDSLSDPEGSVGFIDFNVQSDAGLLPISCIENRAGIYFDDQPVVMTNTVINCIAPNTITVRKYRDINGGTPSFDEPKAWSLEIRQGSLSGPIVASGTGSSVTAPGLPAGTYYAIEADYVGWTHVGYRIDGGSAVASNTNNVEVIVGVGQTLTVDFANFLSADSVKYRSFLHEDIVALVNLKLPKAVKKKNIGGYWEFTLTNPLTEAATELHVQFKNDVNSARPMTYDPFTAVTEVTKKKFDFTGYSVPPSGTVKITGYSAKGKPQQIKKAWFGATIPKPAHAVNKPADFEYLELAMPTYANLIDEVYADAGWFKKGVPPTDSLVVGVVRTDSAKYYGWVWLAKPGDVQKSLRDKTGIHDGDARFFDVFTNGKPLVKQQKTLPPNKHDNELFAEIVALKLGIAASATQHTQLGFGELVYQGSVEELEGMEVKQIADEASAAMTSEIGDAVGYYDAIREINTAFAGDFDTTSFASRTVLTGVKMLHEVPVLRAGTGLIAITTPPVGKYSQVPDVFELAQNYPNPFNPSTTIEFILPVDAIVTLKIYNVLGQEVATLANKELFTEGLNYLEFNASSLPSGVYFYRINADGVDEDGGKFTQVKKMLLMK